MKSWLLASLVFGLVLSCSAFAQRLVDGSAPAINTLVESERAFSRTSSVRGTRDAFLEFLADDGVIFRPGPLNGKQVWGKRAPAPGILTWQPAYAEVSASGDIGYTTGPWEYREKKRDDRPSNYGQFMSIWKKQTDGTWKVALDIGTNNPAPGVAAGSLNAVLPGGKKTPRLKREKDLESERNRLMSQDRGFEKAELKRGPVAALLKSATDDIRIMRDGQFPLTGKPSVRAVPAAEQSILVLQPMKADVSRAGDIGYTYGSYEARAAGRDVVPRARGYYVRVWKKPAGRNWKVALEVLTTIQPASR